MDGFPKYSHIRMLKYQDMDNICYNKTERGSVYRESIKKLAFCHDRDEV